MRWRRLGLAFGLGGLMALSMPPFNLFPLLWLCMPALILLLQSTQNDKQAFATGWMFAFGFFVFGLYWIAASMFVDIKHFWWAVPLSVFGLPAFFAIYYGCAALVARRLGLKGISGAAVFGLLWFLADYMRGHFLTGFPWNLLGYAWSGVLPVLQVTSVVGIYGLTLLTCIAASLPASMVGHAYKAWRASMVGLVFFVALAIGGEIRLQRTQVAMVPDIRLRVVQPDISEKERWLSRERQSHFDELLDLSTLKGDKPVTHIFWPETASTFYLSEDAYHREQIARRIPASSALITGVIRRDVDSRGKTHFYNSLVAVDGLGRLVAGYDKAHLVPFGEFMPLRSIIPLNAVAASEADFTRGPGVRSLRVLGLPLFSPLICYEAIFSGEVVDREDRPDFIVNITNDGWYGNSTGPYQHFAIVRVRAIEEGLPLIRSANTGISGIIDPLGRVISRLGLGKQGFIDSDLPQSLPLTLFAQMGQKILWTLFTAFVVLIFYQRRREKN